MREDESGESEDDELPRDMRDMTRLVLVKISGEFVPQTRCSIPKRAITTEDRVSYRVTAAGTYTQSETLCIWQMAMPQLVVLCVH